MAETITYGAWVEPEKSGDTPQMIARVNEDLLCALLAKADERGGSATETYAKVRQHLVTLVREKLA